MVLAECLVVEARSTQGRLAPVEMEAVAEVQAVERAAQVQGAMDMFGSLGKNLFRSCAILTTF